MTVNSKGNVNVQLGRELLDAVEQHASEAGVTTTMLVRTIVASYYGLDVVARIHATRPADPAGDA